MKLPQNIVYVNPHVQTTGL